MNADRKHCSSSPTSYPFRVKLSDLSGFPIFEQAKYRGVHAADKVLGVSSRRIPRLLLSNGKTCWWQNSSRVGIVVIVDRAWRGLGIQAEPWLKREVEVDHFVAPRPGIDNKLVRQNVVMIDGPHLSAGHTTLRIVRDPF